MSNPVLCGSCFHSSAPGHVCSHCGAALVERAVPMALPVGTLLDGKFVVGDVLGAPGGFGIAYLGWDRVLQRKVVIKELFPDRLVTRLADGGVDVVELRHRVYFNQQRELFLDEARKLARLDGVDAVARVIHYFAQNDTAYFVMPHVAGTSLARRVAGSGRLPPAQVLQWLWPLAQGLQAIHELGLVHRDIKPENVLIDERDRPVLIDFGNATALHEGQTQLDYVAVSRCFAAPEQYLNDLSRTGPWTDVYAVGALLYFCLSGQRPTDSAVRTAGGELLPLDRLVKGLPALLLQVVDRALAIDPALRPASPAELLAMLEPLRPQAFSWLQALPANDFGARMRRVHEQLSRGAETAFSINPLAGLLQGFWFFSHRLLWPGVAASLFLLLAVAVGLWWRVLPWALPLAWLLAALPCAAYADLLLYRRVATLGASLDLAGDEQRQQAPQWLAAAGAPDPRSMLLGFVPPLLALLMWGLVSDFEEDVRYRVRQAVALGDLRARVAAYVAEHQVPPQTLQDVGASFVPNSELRDLQLKAGVIDLVLAVKGASGRRLRWRLDPTQGWVCESRDLPPQYTPPGCTLAE
ncbi:MAG: protein kinase [Rubrivivax sp.]|jgi:serine/threonine protein kinase|nr:protein kinase [Rubrivivax sp.]